MHPRIPLFLAIGAAASGLGGCAGLGAGAVAGIGVFAAQERTIGEGFDDATASATIKSQLMRADAHGFSRVDVEVAAGQALLTGVAPTPEHRAEAERIARAQRQVDRVANEIVIGPPVGLWRSARDEMISASVRAKLLGSKEARALDINVETHDGIVYLMGVVRTEAEVRRTAEMASEVGGVKRVISFVEARGEHLASVAAIGP